MASNTRSSSSVGGRTVLTIPDVDIRFARAEVVLAVLIANFTFEPSGKDIVWNNAGVAYPSVGRESKTPQMPLKVSAIRS